MRTSLGVLNPDDAEIGTWLIAVDFKYRYQLAFDINSVVQRRTQESLQNYPVIM